MADIKFTSGLSTECELGFVGKIKADFCTVLYFVFIQS